MAEKRQKRKIHREGSGYYRNSYSCVVLYMTAAEREAIKAAAEDAGLCMTAYIKDAVDTRMGIRAGTEKD
jgi:hypothetical protein